MSYIKNILNFILKKKGYSIYLYDGYKESLESVKYKWLQEEDIKTIIDVGASDGGYATKIRKILPDTQIISFEPIEDSYKKLCYRFKNDKNFLAYNLALTYYYGKIDFFEYDNKGCSSTFRMEQKHHDMFGKTQLIKEASLKCDSLDNIIGDKLIGKTLLKIDVQGSEINVLAGANKLLSKIDLIYSEVSFCKLYENQPLFNDFVNYLYGKGYSVLGINDISQSLVNGSFLQANIFFRRTH